MDRLCIAALVVCVILTTGAVAAPAFICETRAAAVTLAQSVCALDAECRFAVNVPPPGGDAGWDVLLTQQARVLAADDAPPPPATPDDPRALLWPTAPAWRPWPLLAWSSTLAATHNCTALAANLTAAPLPLELYVLLYVLDVHQARMSITRGCSDANEVAIFDPSDPTRMICECAPDKECHAPSFDVDTGLLWAIAIGAAILVAAVALYIIVASAIQLRSLHKMQKREHKAGASALSL
jgi:hypothetical protein